MDDRAYWQERVGTTLRGTWHLESLIGVGGMAAVFVGVQSFGRRDAIKILHPEVSRSPDLRARFEQEARVMCSFRHPGAVEVLSMSSTEDGLPFLVMELLEGESLGERAKRLGSIPLDEMLRTADEVLDVLGAAHAAGIVHRDIKLDNVFILRSGRAKVLDFGIARIRTAQAVHTRVGSMLGTLPYMPPEQIRGGGDVDGRADLFALGAMMFRLITKRRIHEGRTEAELLVKMSTEPAPLLKTISPETPDSICLVVDRALAFRRERRYPDVATMQRDVRAVLAGQPPPYAMEKLAAGEAPNSLVAPAEKSLSSKELAEAPTVPPPPMASRGNDEAFRDAATAAGAPVGGVGGTNQVAPVSGPVPASVTAPSPQAAGATNPPSATSPGVRANASIMYAPTMMASATSFGLTPNPTPAPATPAAMTPAVAAPAPVAPAPSSVAVPPTNPEPPAGLAPAHTPPPVAKSLITTGKPAEPRKLPLIPALIGGVVCLLLLILVIAMLRGHDDPTANTQNENPSQASGAETSRPSPTTTGPQPGGRKGKRDWNKVRW